MPEVLPAGDLAQANALDQFVRPIALRLAGPALGGVLIERVRRGHRLRARRGVVRRLGGRAAGDGAAARARRRPRRAGTVAGDIREGLRYVRSHVWLWATFASAAIAYLLFMGPAEVLLPFLVKNDLHGIGRRPRHRLRRRRDRLGRLRRGLGQRGLPRRDITFMYVTWTLATLAVAGYGLATAVWQLMLASLAFNALETAGTIVWATAKQRHVPAALLGRVSSLDWLISIGLLPLSFALTGPVSGAIGARDDAHRRRGRWAPSSPSRRCSCPGCATSRAAQKSARPTSTRTTITATTATTQTSARKASSSERSGFSTLRARRPSSTRPPT